MIDNKTQIFRFAIVGTIGFIVDSIVLLSLIQLLNFSPVYGRFISFLIANLVTWICNRNFTFSPSKRYGKFYEWFRFFTSNGVGAGINLSCYTLLIFSKIKYFSSPLVALAIASLIAMTFNFLASKYFVFQADLYKNDRLEAEES